MLYYFILTLCGLPFAQFIFRSGIDIWHCQGLWFQSAVLAGFCLSFYYEPNKIRVKNIPLGLLTLWFGSLTLYINFVGLVGGVYTVPYFLPFFNFLCVIMFYNLCVQHLNKGMVEKVLKALSCIFIFTLLYSVVQAFDLDQFFMTFKLNKWFDKFSNPAVVGFIGNPTHFSAYLGMCLPLVFLQKKRTAWLSISLLFIIILFFTDYGAYEVPITGIITAIITLLYYLFKTHRKSFIIVLSFLIITIIGFYLTLDINARIKLFNSQGRLGYWQYYWELGKHTFITGKGLGSINMLAEQAGVYKTVRHLHNEYYHFLFETGLIGLVAIVYCIWDFFKIKIKEDNTTIILKAIVLGFLIQSFTLFPAHLWMPISILVFCYGSIFAIKNEENKYASYPIGNP